MYHCYTVQESLAQAAPKLWNNGEIVVNTKVYLSILFAFWSISAIAQKENTAQVTPLSLAGNSTNVEVKGSIKGGQILSTLRWAEQSNITCFPGTRFEMFNGNHVFYRVALPAASAMTITVTPKDNAQISLYALRQEQTFRLKNERGTLLKNESREQHIPGFHNASNNSRRRPNIITVW